MTAVVPPRSRHTQYTAQKMVAAVAFAPARPPLASEKESVARRDGGGTLPGTGTHADATFDAFDARETITLMSHSSHRTGGAPICCQDTTLRIPKKPQPTNYIRPLLHR